MMQVQDIDEEFELGDLDSLGCVALASGMIRQARQDAEKGRAFADDALAWLEGPGRGLALMLGVEHELERWMREVDRLARADPPPSPPRGGSEGGEA